MQPVPYLFFKDNCAEAMRFYADRPSARASPTS